MEKYITALAGLLEKLTLHKVLLLGLTLALCGGSYIGYLNSHKIGDRFLGQLSPAGLSAVLPTQRKLAEDFMKKYSKTAKYLTVLRFDFPKNTRTPIYRLFNDPILEAEVFKRLNGGDGSLPMFIKDDESNNNQIISLLSGEMICTAWTAGGLARVWPDMAPQFTQSCRVPIPPGFGGARGYIVVHFKGDFRDQYEMEAMKIDLMTLAVAIHASSD